MYVLAKTTSAWTSLRSSACGGVQLIQQQAHPHMRSANSQEQVQWMSAQYMRQRTADRCVYDVRQCMDSSAFPLTAADSVLVLFCSKPASIAWPTLQACAVAAARTCCGHGAQFMLTLQAAGFRKLYQEVVPRTCVKKWYQGPCIESLYREILPRSHTKNLC